MKLKNHTKEFKSKIAVAAIKGHRTAERVEPRRPTVMIKNSIESNGYLGVILPFLKVKATI